MNEILALQALGLDRELAWGETETTGYSTCSQNNCSCYRADGFEE